MNIFRLSMCFGLLMIGTLVAQDCLSVAELEQAYIGRVGVSSDGKVHVRYGFRQTDSNGYQTDVSVPQGVQNALNSAINGSGGWNSFTSASTGATGVIFEPAPPGEWADLTIDVGEGAGCIGTNTQAGHIRFNTTFLNWAADSENEEDAAVAFKHEIGHFLGLDEASSPTVSIMRQAGGSCGAPSISQDGRSITAGDGMKAGACAVTSLTYQNGVAGSGTGEYYDSWYEGGGCWARVLVTDYYVWNGSYYEYSFSTYVVLEVFCY